ncbi:hypothetical protein [Ensifer sp. Root558]|uniref:hypothetical protein n=1 Tax=Ensifer sp. Root558 TaxID=1736558 RepID=UPI0007135595|nr:hypothetical protein [Ensifer sp. Root558]KQZ47450.1 hypothetical protein ASD63_31895 [Ensifer sp. Root558]
MVEVKKSEDIGMKRGRLLGQLSPARQLDVIAEGLPVLLKSADDLLKAADELDAHPRASAILVGHATEELAKLLVLIDIVRCPPNIRGGLVGTMFKWFYEHLPRLIYAEAQDWRPTTIDQLQEYVDNSRKTHGLEGLVGEHILPNWTLFSRESRLYADIVTYEDGEPTWNEPSEAATALWDQRPSIWHVAKALNDVGAITRPGLDILSEVWGRVEFSGSIDCYSTGRGLSQTMLERLHSANLISEHAQKEQLRWLYNSWQVPMYRIDFKPIQVSLEELKAAREAALWADVGYGYGGY